MNSPACPHSGEALHIRDAGHRCGGCDGLWLPKRYFAAVARERNFVVERFADLLAAQPHTATELSCPAGCRKLLRATVKGVELDWCADCGGVWFDRGEVARLLAHYPLRERSAKGSGEHDVFDMIDLADLASGLFDLFS